MENDIIISAQGYVNGEKGYETIELLEDAVLYKMDLGQLQQLYRQDIEVCNWARQLIEKEFVGTEHRLISNLSMSATERYLQLLKEKPEILQRVQLRHIASYLGISSEHLSRIRASTKSIRKTEWYKKRLINCKDYRGSRKCIRYYISFYQ